MKCIYCSKGKTSVANSRETDHGRSTWRRRSCGSCKRTFTTTERGHADNLFVIKSNGSRQRFVYEKLFASLFLAFASEKGHDNGTSAVRSKKVAAEIVGTLLASAKGKECSTADIITIASSALRNVDVALSEHYLFYSPYRRKIAAKAKLL